MGMLDMHNFVSLGFSVMHKFWTTGFLVREICNIEYTRLISSELLRWSRGIWCRGLKFPMPVPGFWFWARLNMIL